MNNAHRDMSLRSLSYQRNVFAALTLLLAISLIILSSFLFFKRERVIITPAIIEKEFWVDSKTISPTYLEQFGVFLGQLLLNKSAQSAALQRPIILRHTDPSFTGVLRKKLLEEEETLKKQNVAYTFYLAYVQLDMAKLEVSLTGDRIAYAGSKQVSTTRENYVLGFAFNGSRLLLKSVTVKEDK